MFVDFFYQLRDAKIPVTIREYLMLLEALQAGVCEGSVDDFYFLARTSLVKDEKNFDRFDQVFGEYFQGMMRQSRELFEGGIPERWLRAMTQRVFSEEEIARLEAMDFDELMEELRKRLAEQTGEHSGGNKWIGTGGTSPFGNSGVNPAGIRIGGEGGGGSATKVWKKREFRGLTGDVEIGTRNIKVALRRLRKFLREGAEDEFDLDSTIDSTAKNAAKATNIAPITTKKYTKYWGIKSSHLMMGRKRDHMASMRKSPAARAASTISCASAALMAKGFSQSTWAPAARRALVCTE